MNIKKMQRLITDSLDRELNPKEKQRLDEALKHSPELRDFQNKMEKIQSGLANARRDTFEPWFADRVMNAINYIPRKEMAFDQLFVNLQLGFRRLAIVASFVFVLIFGFNISTSSTLKVSDVFGLDRMSIEELADPYNYLTME